MDSVKARLEAIYPDMVAWRRHLHRNPELSYQEERTAAFVAEKLVSWGLEVRTGVGGHGVIGTVKGAKPGPAVALRADLDALPIQDAKECDYASAVPGVMHACGHDAHTAALLGLAKLFQEEKEELAGEVRFLFQPAEELSPGGAAPMILDGALEGIDAVYGVHLWTPFPSGTVYSRPGPIMAAADEFSIRIKGKGGHGALPHETVDSVVVGAHLVVNLQSIVSRFVDPLTPCVITTGSFHAGSGFNVIAESCKMSGTVRTFDTGLRDRVRERMARTVQDSSVMFGAAADFDYKQGYPPVVNPKEEVERFFRVAGEQFGSESVQECAPVMAGEDFAYYLQKVPGCFMFVGAGNRELGIEAPHHHPAFDIDEASMLQAAQLLHAMARDRLNEG